MSPTTGQKINSWILRMALIMMMVALTAVTAFADTEDTELVNDDTAVVAEAEADSVPAVAPEQEEEQPADVTDDAVVVTDETAAPADTDTDAAVQPAEPVTETEEVVAAEPAAEAAPAVTEESEAAPAVTVAASEETPVVTAAAPKATTTTPKVTTPKSKWVQKNGKYYYYNKYGKLLTKGFHFLNGNKYYFNADGSVRTGLFQVDGKTYYGKKTDKGRLITNKKINLQGKRYLMSASGAAKEGYIKVSSKVRYITDSTGKIKTGWFWYNGKRYHAGKDGILTVGGLKKISGKYYYFFKSGSVARNTTKTVDGFTYKFNKKGVMTRKTVDGKTVVDYALQFVGNPYVAGGSSLTHGTDCSGFTMSIYAHYGIDLDHYSYSQMYSGKKVSSPQPGDLVFYYGGGHVAMYVGNGKVVHAMTSRYGIQVTSMYICGTPCAYRRVLN